MRRKLFSQQDDTKIINFDEGILILSTWQFFWGNVIFKICHFCLKSHNWRQKILHSLASPGKVSTLALKMKTAWIKRSRYVTVHCYNPGKLLKEIPP